MKERATWETSFRVESFSLVSSVGGGCSIDVSETHEHRFLIRRQQEQQALLRGGQFHVGLFARVADGGYFCFRLFRGDRRIGQCGFQLRHRSPDRVVSPTETDYESANGT